MNTVKSKICLGIDFICRLVLGGIFIYAAWTKIQDPALFAESVASYRLLPSFVIGIFALVLPMVELLAGCALIVTKWSRESALILLGLLFIFLIGLTQAQLRGLDISCGCFGSENGAEESIGGAIIRDLCLLAPAIWLTIRPNRWILAYQRNKVVDK